MNNSPAQPASLRSSASPETKNNRNLLRIASLSTALAFGCLAASTASLRRSNAGFTFEITLGTFVAFAIGAAVAVWYWRLMASSRPAARNASWLLLLVGVCLFLYPLRFVPTEKLTDVATGLALAAGALSIGGFIIWRISRYLEADSASKQP